MDFLINAGARFDEGGTVAKNSQRSDWKNHKTQCRNIKAMRDKFKDKSKIKEEINEAYCQFQMEEQAKNDEAGPSI